MIKPIILLLSVTFLYIFTAQRSQWIASGRSSSMDSGISELLPSSPGGSPSPIIPHSPSRPTTRPGSGDIINRKPSGFHRPSSSQRAMGQQNDEQSHSRSPSRPNVSSRPNSAFSGYSALPHIGQQGSDMIEDSNNLSNNSPKTSNDTDIQNRALSPKHPPASPSGHHHHQPSPTPPPPTTTSSRPHSGKKISTRELRRQQFARRKHSSQQDTTSSSSSAASAASLSVPSENEPRILLAVKLPSGERLQRYFRPSDCFADVCQYAEQESKQSLSECNLYINQVPKILIANWRQTFNEASLRDRTLLCLEEKDDD